MKKEDVISTLVYLVMLVIVVIVGYFIISANSEAILSSLGNNSSAIYGFVIISLIIGVLINVIFVEVGHALGAKIGGYNILSFNVFGLCFYKVLVNDKLKTKFGFKSFDGLAGETKILPSSRKEKHNPVAYIIFPFVLILLEFLALYLSFMFISDDSNLAFIKYAIVLIATVGGLFILYDYIPFKLDAATDGYRYTLLVKKINVEAYNTRLEIEGNILLNKDNKNYKVFDEITDYTADVNFLSIYNYLENYDYESSFELINKIINTTSKVSNETILKAKMWYLYLLLKEDKLDEAKKYFEEFDDSATNYLKKNNSLLTLRTYNLYLIKVEKAESLIEETSIKYLKTYKNEVSTFKEKDKKLFESDVVNNNSENKKSE